MNAYIPASNRRNIRKFPVQIGEVFGRLTVVGTANPYRSDKRWQCCCECGSVTAVRQGKLVSGWTKSCGCLNEEITLAATTTHGKTKSTEHAIWRGIKARCTNSNYHSYPEYGGRGVQMCSRWLNSFEAFLQDMGTRPSLKHSIDRIDNNGNYEPENCRWATRDIQSRNTRRNNLLKCNDQIMCMTDWAKELNISHGSLRYKLKKSMTVTTCVNGKIVTFQFASTTPNT